MNVKTFKEYKELGISPDILFWVGCAGSYDDRAKKITKSLINLFNKSGISFGVLGVEESCSGDPAKRCFNTIKNEYPELGGIYEVVHHSQLIDQLINDGKLKIKDDQFNGKKITFHDPCYLGRANGEYYAPRKVIKALRADLKEMKSCKEKAMCCGAGGAQMFKDSEKGNKEINIKRTEEAIETKSNIIAAACPFCNTMLTDGIKSYENHKEIQVKDISELIDKVTD